MRGVGAFFISVLILQGSRFVGAVGHIHVWSFACGVALVLLFWKVRPAWAALTIWIGAVIAGSLAAAVFNLHFPDPHEGGALVWWPLIGYLLYRKAPLHLAGPRGDGERPAGTTSAPAAARQAERQ